MNKRVEYWIVTPGGEIPDVPEKDRMWIAHPTASPEARNILETACDTIQWRAQRFGDERVGESTIVVVMHNCEAIWLHQGTMARAAHTIARTGRAANVHLLSIEDNPDVVPSALRADLPDKEDIHAVRES